MPSITVDTSLDAAHAVSTAKSIASAYSAARLQGYSPREAEIAITARLTRASVTESSQAFNDERRQLIKKLGMPDIVQVWNATLDKYVCKECAAMDGTRKPLGYNFDIPMHPYCRCFVTLEPKR